MRMTSWEVAQKIGEAVSALPLDPWGKSFHFIGVPEEQGDDLYQIIPGAIEAEGEWGGGCVTVTQVFTVLVLFRVGSQEPDAGISRILPLQDQLLDILRALDFHQSQTADYATSEDGRFLRLSVSLTTEYEREVPV